jgi:hypothetical protein
MCPTLLCCLATLSCSINKAHDLWPIQQLVNPRTPTSEQFIIEGLTFWCNGCKSRVGTKKVDSRCTVKLNLLSTPQGMKKGLAFLTLALNHPNTATVCYSFINCKEDLSDSGNATKEVELLGAKRDYYEALLCLSSAFSYLIGSHIFVENGDNWFVPSLSALTWIPSQQTLVIFMVIAYEARHMKSQYGFDSKAMISPGIYGGLHTFYMNLEMPTNMEEQVGKEGSPEDVVDYLERELENGRNWDNGVHSVTVLWLHYLRRSTSTFGTDCPFVESFQMGSKVY